MPRTTDDRTERVHLHLYANDLEWIRQHYAQTIGVSKAVRSIVRQWVKQIEAKVDGRAAPTNVKVEGLE